MQNAVRCKMADVRVLQLTTDVLQSRFFSLLVP